MSRAIASTWLYSVSARITARLVSVTSVVYLDCMSHPKYDDRSPYIATELRSLYISPDDNKTSVGGYRVSSDAHEIIASVHGHINANGKVNGLTLKKATPSLHFDWSKTSKNMLTMIIVHHIRCFLWPKMRYPSFSAVRRNLRLWNVIQVTVNNNE
jgi:hypothetical protein